MPIHNVISRFFFTQSTYKLTIEKKNIIFKPGQHFSLGTVDNAINREYSIYNGSNEENLEFLIKKISNGIVSKELADKNNNKVIVLGPYSDFILPNNLDNKKFLFIATGTGIAPFASFIKSYKNLDYKLIFGTRYETEIYDKNLYEKNIKICISREKEKRHVQDVLNELFIDEFNYIYLCGNSKMIVDVQNLIQKKNYKGIVKTEVFF